MRRSRTRRTLRIYHWAKVNFYKEIYPRYKNQWVAVKDPSIIYHNKDSDVLLKTFKKRK